MGKRGLPALLLAILTWNANAQAEDFLIESLDHSGRLIFNEQTNAAGYRVEWAPSAEGPWTNTWNALAYIPAGGGTGAITSSVPMFFRVVALEGSAMVSIPAGTNSGSNPLASGEEYGTTYPATYSLTNAAPFLMDATAVTWEKWEEVRDWGEANGYSFDNPGAGKGDTHPVQDISWYDAIKWCNARSEREGFQPCYTVSNAVYRAGQFVPDVDRTHAGYRIPDTAEWEYAARGGLQSQRFPNGSTIDHTKASYFADTATYSYDQAAEDGFNPEFHFGSIPFTAPAASFPPNGYGLYDMDGNVATWCWEPQYSSRQYRGGSCGAKANNSRCGQINWMLPADTSIYTGIRCVRLP